MRYYIDFFDYTNFILYCGAYGYTIQKIGKSFAYANNGFMSIIIDTKTNKGYKRLSHNHKTCKMGDLQDCRE